MDITGFTFWDLQKAAKAILCSALSSATRQQYQIADSARKSKKPSKSVPKYGTLAFERKRAKHYREKNAVLKENNRKLQEIINGANLDTKFALNALGLSPTKSVSSIATTFMSPSRSLSAISSTSTTPLLV
jgi:glutamate synthase domain-containing protein 2